jgi:hypothetical protein
LHLIASEDGFISAIAFLDQNLTISHISLIETTLSGFITETQSKQLSVHVLKLLEIFNKELMGFANLDMVEKLFFEFSH